MLTLLPLLCRFADVQPDARGGLPGGSEYVDLLLRGGRQ